MTPLRVVFITQEDPFYIAEFFRTFRSVAPPAGEAQTVAAFILDTLGQRGPLGLLKRMHALYGPVGLTRVLFRLAVKLIRSAAHRFLGIGPPVSVEQILLSCGIPTRRLGDVNAAEAIASIRAFEPDAILSVAATQKFSPALLACAPRGCWNSHSGDLPRFRGMMPTFWTLYENEPAATVTVHRMAENIDAGDIWRQERVAIAPEDSLDDVIRATKQLSARMMSRLVSELSRGDVQLRPNDSSRKSSYRFPTARDSAALRRRGRRLL